MTQPAAQRDANRGLQKALDHLTTHNISRRRDMSWPVFLVELLRVASTLEHKLMVQYLFAAYSLGGPQVPEQYRDNVRAWQESLLTVAREEMGHLLTVQNILTFLGAEVSFATGEFAWEVPYFPYEAVSLDSLACYVYVEMNTTDIFPEKEEIMKRACAHARVSVDKLIPVEELYAVIIALLGDLEKIPESALRPDSYLSQASWDDWGRGYQPDPRSLDAEGSLDDGRPAPADHHRAILLINNVCTRTQAIAALTALSTQGEGPSIRPGKRIALSPDSEAYTEEGTDPREPSHFERFIKFYREMKKLCEGGWQPALPVATNPSTVEVPAGTYISSKRARDWAELFNMRYRMLLMLLTHTFRLARSSRPDEPSVRAVTMHRVFGEMYNLKTIATLLVQMPLSDDPADPRRAGPPFRLPNTHSLPPTDADCWSLDIDMLKTADGICREILLEETQTPNRNYLLTLLDLDNQRIKRIEKILTGLSSMERYS